MTTKRSSENLGPHWLPFEEGLIQACTGTGPTRHSTDHFADESFRAINCTGDENEKVTK